VFRHVLDFLYPPRCAGCGSLLPIGAGRRICVQCLKQIERLDGPLCGSCGVPMNVVPGGSDGRCTRCMETEPNFAQARAVARYTPTQADGKSPLSSIIRRHKYGLDQSLGGALAECLGDELPLSGENYDVVVAVPLHHQRLRWRGFNQAALLAREVARRLNCRFEPGVLVRVRPASLPQTEQDRAERKRNVRGAFVVRRPALITARRVLLVDDVMTTGATADECARALLQGGALGVDVFTLARTP
jgi:ComF family protein